MNRQMKQSLAALAFAAALGFSGAAGATLFDRGGGLIYDNVLNITWLQDANYAKTSNYDADGDMTWDQAMAWADQLVYGGYSDWRLPFMVDTGRAYCNWAYYGADCGYNVQTASEGIIYSELASLWYNTLGNLAYYDTAGNGPQTGWGLQHTGANGVNFVNLWPVLYWFRTEYNPYTPNAGAWGFNALYGSQEGYDKDSVRYAWAVRPGDVVAAVPEPVSIALVGLGLVGLGWVRRRRG